MLYHGSTAGAFDLKKAVMETITSMRRAGVCVCVCVHVYVCVYVCVCVHVCVICSVHAPLSVVIVECVCMQAGYATMSFH